MLSPFTAIMCAINVLAVRASELENGIEIMDSNGHTVGMSQKAGEKVNKVVSLPIGLPFSPFQSKLSTLN